MAVSTGSAALQAIAATVGAVAALATAVTPIVASRRGRAKTEHGHAVQPPAADANAVESAPDANAVEDASNSGDRSGQGDQIGVRPGLWKDIE
jgi:hypothetical protein